MKCLWEETVMNVQYFPMYTKLYGDPQKTKWKEVIVCEIEMGARSEH